MSAPAPAPVRAHRGDDDEIDAARVVLAANATAQTPTRAPTSTGPRGGSKDVPNGNAGASRDSREDARGGLANRVNDFFGVKFQALGRASAATPYRVLACAFAACVLFAVGLGAPGLTNEKRGDKLWVPTGTPAQGDKTYVDAMFGSETRVAQVILTSQTAGANVLTPSGLAALESIAQSVRSTTIDWEGSTYSYTDHCFRAGPNCYEKSALNAFSNAAGYATQSSIDATLSVDPITNPTDGTTVRLIRSIGGVTYDGSAPRATAISLTFLFKNDEVLSKGEYVNPKGDAFDSKLLTIFADAPSGYKTSYFTDRSFSDEFGSTVNRDITKLQIALIAILIYATMTLSKWSEGCNGARVGVTMCGIVSIGMAVASAYGLGAYFGIFYSPLMNVLPFLLLGIGVDDMFVIVNAYDNAAYEPDPNERMARALRVAGMSITVTSFTDIIAFLIGSTTSLPALRNFCFYAAFGIFFDYLYQITFFTACLALDEKRKSRNKADCFFCLDCPPAACCACCKPEKMKKSPLQKFLGQGLGVTLGNFSTKIAVLATFCAITAAGIAGATKIEVDADVGDFIPDGSYLKTYISETKDLFTTYGDDVQLYAKGTLDLPQDDSVLLAATAAFKNNQYIIDASVRSWIDDFKSANPNVNSGNYISSLKTWLSSGVGAQYQSDVVFDNDTAPTAILASRVHGNHPKTDKSRVSVRGMDSVRSDISAVSGNDGQIFAYGAQWLNYEQYKSISAEAFRNISITLAACFVIIGILVVEWKTVVSVSLSLCLTFTNIVGYMHFWGLTIDSVTVIMLVIALGLAVDYSAHIGRAYLEKRGSPNERIVSTLEDMGVAVWNGAMSTFMAVLILGSSDSYVFQTFFKQLFLCIVLGLSHGMIFLPTVLSLVKPEPYDDAR